MKRSRSLKSFLGIALLLLLGLFVFLYFNIRHLSPSGGLYFPRRLEIPVPHFCQHDKRWRGDQLAWTDGTLGQEGCAVSSAAMILKFYGIDTDPGRLNATLAANGGYTVEGWIYWEAAAYLDPHRIRLAYEDLPSYYLIDSNLIKGNPVIVRVRLSDGITHFVVISGKQGFDYLITDPMTELSSGIYPLRELHSKIEALRFYEKVL